MVGTCKRNDWGWKEVKMEGQDDNNVNENANAGANKEPVGVNVNRNTNRNDSSVTFDDFLKEGKNQAEFDRRVQKAIQTAQESWKIKNDQERSEAERLAQMNETEKLQYELSQKDKSIEEIQKKLNARDLKDEAIKIATTQDTAFDPEFLNLFDYESMTAEQLQEKTKLIKTIQDRIVEKTVSEWSKEKPPYYPNQDNGTDVQVSQAFGNN